MHTLDAIALEQFTCQDFQGLGSLATLGVTSDAGDECFEKLYAAFQSAKAAGMEQTHAAEMRVVREALGDMEVIKQAYLDPIGTTFKGKRWTVENYNTFCCAAYETWGWIGRAKAASDTPILATVQAPSVTPLRTPAGPVYRSQLTQRLMVPFAEGKPVFADGEAEDSYTIAQRQVTQNNPESMNTPAPGSVPVTPGQVSSSFWDNLFKTLTIGATQYQKIRLQDQMLKAQRSNKTVWIPQKAVQQAQRQSTTPWGLIGGGAAALVAVGLVIYFATRNGKKT